MPCKVEYANKKTGVVYVYESVSYWDKSKKQPRNKRVCIGKRDPTTGDFIPSKRLSPKQAAVRDPSVTAISRVAGPYLILEQITRQHKIDKLLKKCFHDKWEIMLSLVYFIVHKGTALSRSEPWSTACLHPFSKSIASQRISELLREISEDERINFLAKWLEHVLEEDYLCYDITSVSSYAKHNEYTHFGYNRDNEMLEQINLAMLFGQKSSLPAYYRRMPGNISDVATLKTTIKSLNFLGITNMHFVLDRGFYSIANIDELCRRRHKFTIALPAGRKWVEKILDKDWENITSPMNYLTTGKDEALYAATELYKWGESNHRAYLHLYYNAERAANDFDRFTRKLIAYRKELLTGKTLEKHQDYYDRYLIVKKTPKRGLQVSFNEEAIQKYRKRYSGFFCIMSNKVTTTEEALNIYRNKDSVENCFDDLKNHLDMKRLRVHNASAMDSRLFLQFIALIYISSIRNMIQKDDKLKYFTTREVMEEMETLVKIKYSNRYGQLFTETTPIQKQILKVFGVELPT